MFQLRWHGIVVVCGRPVGTGTVVTVQPRGYLQWCRCGDGLGIAVLVSRVYNEWGPSVLYVNQICIIQPNYKLGVLYHGIGCRAVGWQVMCWVQICSTLSSVVGNSVVHVWAVRCDAWVGLFSTCRGYKCVYKCPTRSRCTQYTVQFLWDATRDLMMAQCQGRNMQSIFRP